MIFPILLAKYDDDDDDDEFLHRFGRSPCGASAGYKFVARKTLWGIKTSSSCQ
jgi:hypothetical protein